MVPESKRTAVALALREAFGVAEFENIRQIESAVATLLDFRIQVGGRPYLLRIMPCVDERFDPGRIFACMGAAAEAGLAPKVRYANAVDGISIMDFVEARPFTASYALAELPGMLRRLHDLPPFPKAFNYVTAHNWFIWRFRKTNLLPDNEVAGAFTQYAKVCAVYPRLDSDMVSCHMDLKPENILFDGQRLWLVDWKAAFVNDRYFDLAVAANFLIAGESDEIAYLREYFGQDPDEYQRARFFLMQQVVHMLSATVYVLLGSAGKPTNLNGKQLSFREFHQRIWAGEVNLADNDLKIAYGMVHWNQLLSNVHCKRFDEALRVVSERDVCAESVSRLLPSAQ